MLYYLNYFFVFSIFGHALETVLSMIFNWNMKSGFLYGYWTPVYGFGVVLILIVSKLLFKKLKMNKFIEIIIFFFSISIILSFIEFLGGHFLHLVFNKDFWTYKNHKFNIGKYISVEMTIVWGVCSLIFLYLIKPWCDKLIKKIPKIITYIFLILFIIDNIMTFIIKSKI